MMIIITFILGALVATIWLERRASWLASIDFRVTYPNVPASVTTSIRKSEGTYYASRPFYRRAIESTQDIITFAVPSLTYAMNFSVGPYRLKARSIEELLPWAIENGYLELVDVPADHAKQSIAYFSEQPALSDWGATVILERLRLRHPQLQKKSWAEIAGNPILIAKLYSGYMGAGGAWEEWEADLKPGPEAMRRMGLNKTQ